MKTIVILLVASAAVVMSSSLHAEPRETGLIASASVLGIAGAIDSSAKTLADKPGLTKAALRKLFEDTEWVAGKDDDKHLFFHRDGKLTGVGNGWRFFYTVEAPDILKFYQTDPSKDRKAEFELYRVNTAAMLAQFDAQRSTFTGSGLGTNPLKYVGPAPKK